MNFTLLKNVSYYFLVLVASLYCGGLYGWAALNASYQDRWWWLFFLNTFALYLFAPLLFLILLGLAIRRTALWISIILAGALFLFHYGLLLMPPLPDQASTEITVMTYNVLGFNDQISDIVLEIKNSNADIIALQELNPTLAQALQTQLSDIYPYQILAEAPGPCGIGTISRYPLQVAEQGLGGEYWCGLPQVLNVDFANYSAIVINFHAIPPPGPRAPDRVEWATRQREIQAKLLADFATSQAKPTLILGDLNATDQSTAYKTLNQSLGDAWRNGGWGLGHTFPGSAVPGSSRARIAGILVPKWILRIDYIFHTPHWHTQEAWVGDGETLSDHRAVLARLALLE